jgi:hypothetical protein
LADNRKHAEKLQLHRERIASVKRPIKWRALRERIGGTLFAQASLAEGNPNLMITMTTPGSDSNSFILNHPAFPKARVNVSFRDELLIEAECSWQKNDGSDPTNWSEIIDFEVDERDNLHFRHKGEIVSDDDVARLLLAPVRDPAFKPKKGGTL